jgi:hypothetical protein
MSKRQREEFLAAATQLAEQLSALDDELSVSDLKAVLRECGSDPDGLLDRFHTAIRDMESRLWAKGKTPPAYLRRLVNQTAAPGALPSDRKAALGRVKDWLGRFREGLADTVAPAELEVLRAYRKDGELSSKDVSLLDELEQTLKTNVAARKKDD